MDTEPLPALLDVIVIGGSAAGLTAAIALGRSRRSVLVIDSGEPRNAPSPGVHNLLGHDGIAPAELRRRGRDEAARYGVHLLDATATAARGATGGFEVDAGGRTLSARRLIVATGAVDELPSIPGLAEHWGTSVLHCPYCHGWEVRDRRIGIVGSDRAMHQAALWRQLSGSVTLFAHDAVRLSAADERTLAARGVEIVPGRIGRVLSTDGVLDGIELDNGDRHALDALVIASAVSPRASAIEQLGLVPKSLPNGMGSAISADAAGQAEVPGVWVAGNVTDPYGTVAAAVADGVRAGAQANADLVAEEVRRAVEAAG